MSKPSRFAFVRPDAGIDMVAWWGERLMAVVIAATTLSILMWTQVDALLELSDFVSNIVVGVACVYVALLTAIAVYPTRWLHELALPFGMVLYATRTLAFWDLWLDHDLVSFNNVVERFFMTCTILIFHTWGLWSDRRPV